MKISLMVKRSILLFVTTAVIASAVIYSASMFLLIRTNALSLLKSFWDTMEVVVIPQDDSTEEDLQALVSFFKQLEGIEDARIITSREGLQLIADDKDILPMIREHERAILPHVVIVSPQMKYTGDYAQLIASIHQVPRVADVKYSADAMERLKHFANQFQFIHRGLVWIVLSFSICFIFYAIRFFLLPGVAYYSVLVLLQGVAGMAGALIGWVIFVVHFYPQWSIIKMVASISPSLVAAGIVLGWMAGLFVIGTYEPLPKEESR